MSAVYCGQSPAAVVGMCTPPPWPDITAEIPITAAKRHRSINLRDIVTPPDRAVSTARNLHPGCLQSKRLALEFWRDGRPGVAAAIVERLCVVVRRAVLLVAREHQPEAAIRG